MADFKVFIATEVRVYKVGGHYYASQSFIKTIKNYYESFGKVILATRIITEKKSRNGYEVIDGFCSGFDNIGSISRFLFKRTPENIKSHIAESNLVVLRLPSVISLKMIHLVKHFSKEYLVEIMGCAWDALWNHDIVGKMIAPYMFLKTRKIVRNANYCMYVTDNYLQKRYPSACPSVGVSDVDISRIYKPRKYNSFDNKNFSILTAAAIDVKYKGQQYVIKAISKLKSDYGINITYYLAGGGTGSRLRRVAKRYGVEKNVVFTGMLSREELDEYMEKVDVYVQPSLTEGLPRSLIEAMSHGLVCLGSNAGGIPELLDERQIFKRKSVSAIVKSFLGIIRSKNLGAISERNIEKSKNFLSKSLDEKRMSFFKTIQNGLSRDKTKVVIAINKLIGGGAERVTCNLANYLSDHGYEVEIILVSNERESYELNEGVRVVNLLKNYSNSKKIRVFLLRRKAIKRYMSSHGDASCYIAMMPLTAFLITRFAKYTDAKIIISERNYPVSYNRRDRYMMGYASKRCDGLVVQTKVISDWYSGVLEKTIIHNAVNKDVIVPKRDSDSKRFVAVARLEEQKNYPMLIESFKRVSDLYPEYTLEICGKGKQEKEIRGLIDRYGLRKKVKLLGFVKNVPQQIVGAKCFVMTSDYEGMPNALIEAMCMGLPCVTTDFDGGGARELIKNGTNGVLVNKGDVKEMASSMIRIIEDDAFRKKISKNAFKIRDELSSEKIYSEWLRFVNRILSNGFNKNKGEDA